MFRLSATPLGFEMRRFQREVPFGWTIGVINQHKMWVVFQPLSLQLHRVPVLLHKLCENKLQQRRPKRYPIENIPAGDDINAAVIVGNRRDRGQTREPIFASPNRLRPHIGKNKINRGGDRVGIGIHTQKLIRPTV